MDKTARKYLSLLIKTIISKLSKFGMLNAQEKMQWDQAVKELESQK